MIKNCLICTDPDLCTTGCIPCDLSGEYITDVPAVVANQFLADYMHKTNVIYDTFVYLCRKYPDIQNADSETKAIYDKVKHSLLKKD